MGGHAIFESSAQLNFILCERDGRDFTCFGWFLPTNRSGLPPPPRNAVSPNALRKEQGINLEDSWQVGAAAKEAWQVQGTQCASTVQSN